MHMEAMNVGVKEYKLRNVILRVDCVVLSMTMWNSSCGGWYVVLSFLFPSPWDTSWSYPPALTFDHTQNSQLPVKQIEYMMKYYIVKLNRKLWWEDTLWSEDIFWALSARVTKPVMKEHPSFRDTFHGILRCPLRTGFFVGNNIETCSPWISMRQIKMIHSTVRKQNVTRQTDKTDIRMHGHTGGILIYTVPGLRHSER